MQLNPVHTAFVAEVEGIDLRQPLDAREVAAIEAGMDRYAVLIYHGQPLNDTQQLAFSRRLGDIEPSVNSNVTKLEERRLSIEVSDISNLDQHSTMLAREDRRREFALGNRLWHSDSSYKPIPSKYSLLSARVIPSTGGNTEFADMRAAYDALDDATKAEIESLVVEHSLLYSRGQLGFTFTPEEQTKFAPVGQRLVRTHPVSGRKSLFLASHAGAIVGWPVPEGRSFLRDLMEHATQPQFVYAHKWRQHDLVMWDNRQTMHRARPFKDASEVRDMHRTTIAGDGPTVEQARPAHMSSAESAAAHA